MKAPYIHRLPLMLSLLGVLAIGLGGVVELAAAERHQSTAGGCVESAPAPCRTRQLFPGLQPARNTGPAKTGPVRVGHSKPGLAGTRA